MPPKVDKTKAIWDDNKDKYLLKLLKKQIDAGKRSDSGFKKEAWIQITADFNTKFSPPYDRDQIKTRVQTVRSLLFGNAVYQVLK